MHPRDTDTAVCVNMWAPGTPARRLRIGSVETLAQNLMTLLLRVKVCQKKVYALAQIKFSHSFGLFHILWT